MMKANRNHLSTTNQSEGPQILEGLTAEELASRVQRGSRRSYDELVNRFGPRLHCYFRMRFSNREDCEDLVQETMVKAYLNIKRYKPSRSFSTWLYTIGTRTAVDRFRADNRQFMARIDCDVPTGGDPSETASRREEMKNLWDSARTLPKKQFDALWLRYSEDMAVKEIAGVLRISRVHVKVLLHRARTRLIGLQAQREKTVAGREEGVLQGVLSH